MLRRAKAWVLRLVRAMKIAAGDERIPRPLRLLAGIGLLPIPGPFDEVLLVLLAPMFLLYRGPLREAWRDAAR